MGWGGAGSAAGGGVPESEVWVRRLSGPAVSHVAASRLAVLERLLLGTEVGAGRRSVRGVETQGGGMAGRWRRCRRRRWRR